MKFYLFFIFGILLFMIFIKLFIFLWGYIISEVFSFAYSRLNDKGIVFTFVKVVETKKEEEERLLKEYEELKKNKTFEN